MLSRNDMTVLMPHPLSALALALPLEQDNIGPDHRHRLKRVCPLCPPVDGVDTVDRGGQRVVLRKQIAFMSLKVIKFALIN